jgi:hypothetical protein
MYVIRICETFQPHKARSNIGNIFDPSLHLLTTLYCARSHPIESLDYGSCLSERRQSKVISLPSFEKLHSQAETVL